MHDGKNLRATAPTTAATPLRFLHGLIRRGLVFADDADFWFQVDAVCFFDAFLDFVDDVEDIPCRRVARVDDEAGVFHRDLGIAAGKAFEAGLVDEGPGKVSRRTLEGTAGAVHFQRLLAAAAVHEIVHTGLDFLGVAAAQGQFDFDDKFLGFLEAALAIGKTEVRRIIRMDTAFAVDRADAGYDMAHFPVVSPGVHEDGAAQGTGDATGKFDAGQAVFLGKLADIFQHVTGTGQDLAVVAGQYFSHRIQLDDDAPDAAIADEDVGAAAEDRHRQFQPPCCPDGQGHFLDRFRQDQDVGRAADSKGRVLAHGFVEQDPFHGNRVT